MNCRPDSSHHIPLDRPCLTGGEAQWVAQAMADGTLGGGGTFSRRCEDLLHRELGGAAVILTSSCTTALEMSSLLLDTGPGTEIVVPSFTFVSTANAFARHGARPVFCDINPRTLNMDETLLDRHLTPRTRAIVPVHYGGVGCEMDRLLEVAAAHGVRVVEDNAHGIFARYKRRPLGTFGDLAALSFDRAKNFTCGEGGALLVNAAELVSRAEVIRDRGTDRVRFLRGEVGRYTWVDLGTNPQISELASAFLFGQLQARERVEVTRRRIWESYYRDLVDWGERNGVALPHVPAHCASSCHLFHLVMPAPVDRDALIEHLRSSGIAAASHYQPLHLSEMGRRFGAEPGDCPVTEYVSERLVRLPLYNDLAAADVDRVIGSVRRFSCGRG